MTVSYVDDPGYANAKLGDSVICYQGFPYRVLEVMNSGLTVLRDFADARNIEVPLAELDLTPISLGYMNSNRVANYIMRVPSRQWRQGLRSGLIYSMSGHGRDLFRDPRAFINLVRGVYPSPSDVMDALVNDEADSMAFSRHFAIVRSSHKKPKFYLQWKGRIADNVGIAQMGDRRVEFTLEKRYEYLSEMLEEERNGRA